MANTKLGLRPRLVPGACHTVSRCCSSNVAYAIQSTPRCSHMHHWKHAISNMTPWLLFEVVHKAPKGCSLTMCGLVPVVLGLVVVAVGLLLVLVLVVGLCILCTNCATGPTRVTLGEWGGCVTSNRIGKIQLRQNTVLDQPSNSCCCSCLALKNRLIETSKTASCIWLRPPGLRYRR